MSFLKKSWDWSYNLTQDFISYTHSPPLFPFFTQRLRPNIIYSNVTWPCHMTQGSRDLDLGHVTLIYSMTTICLRCIHVQSSPSCSILIHSLLMSFSSLKEKKKRENPSWFFVPHNTLTHMLHFVVFYLLFSVQNKRCIAQWSILSLLSSLILFLCFFLQNC